MERRIMFEDSNLKLEYVAEGNYLHQTWWGITSKEVFANLLNESLLAFEKTGAMSLLLDAREHKGLGPESQALAAKFVGEFAQKNGTVRQAIVVPTDIFSQFSVENYTNKVKNNKYPVESMFFDSIENAEKWLNDEI